MKCPTCVANNKKSMVYVGCSTITLMMSNPYYDEDGNYHTNDLNIRTMNYNCSNGHVWQERRNSEGEIVE